MGLLQNLFGECKNTTLDFFLPAAHEGQSPWMTSRTICGECRYCARIFNLALISPWMDYFRDHVPGLDAS